MWDVQPHQWYFFPAPTCFYCWERSSDSWKCYFFLLPDSWQLISALALASPGKAHASGHTDTLDGAWPLSLAQESRAEQGKIGRSSPENGESGVWSSGDGDGSLGACAGAIRQCWGWETVFGEDSQLLEPKLLLLKSMWLLTSLAGDCHNCKSAGMGRT